jgi:hypothetical protein
MQDGEIEIVEVPTAKVPIAKTPLPPHLGYYEKAREIRTLLEALYSERRIFGRAYN